MYKVLILSALLLSQSLTFAADIKEKDITRIFNSINFMYACQKEEYKMTCINGEDSCSEIGLIGCNRKFIYTKIGGGFLVTHNAVLQQEISGEGQDAINTQIASSSNAEAYAQANAAAQAAARQAAINQAAQIHSQQAAQFAAQQAAAQHAAMLAASQSAALAASQAAAMAAAQSAAAQAAAQAAASAPPRM